MKTCLRLASVTLFLVLSLSNRAGADSPPWKMEGTKRITLHTRDGQAIPIGTVDFQPQGDGTTFKIDLDKKPFKVFFLSMRNFDCIEGFDVECFVPYPYDNPRTASPRDLNWLADNLLFMFKTKAEHAATMSNGIRYDLKLTDHGIAGKPQAINLDDIASPPKNPAIAPFPPSDRDEYPEGNRWIEKLTIE